ncbi:Membrane-bound lytic murein transglycosylase C precursor [Aliarcobacter thereius]|uniref:Membrane-bound lytic murein transglycosylase C n=1 Tax=Aliarcobacter thereius TaxID=544718 RepID=A0A1C0B8F2_9BACT|nr:murein transglycosylase domain-containing protein [Aliarcobacter thereius]OCL99857.1 Membrane-bound lytic murein transglycosylase C precursor [Aliarcobacter thereius]
MKAILFILISSTILYAEISHNYEKSKNEFIEKQNNFNLEKKQILNKHNSYKEEALRDFENYKKAQQKIFDDFKNEVSKLWENPKMPSAKSLINYTNDRKTRGEINFENEEIIVETIASSYNEAVKNLRKELNILVSIDTKEFNKIDPFEKELSSIKKSNKIIDSSFKNESILSDAIFGKKPSKKELNSFSNSNINNKSIKVQNSPKIPNQKVYSVIVPMPNQTMINKSKEYEREVTKQGKIRSIPRSLIFAVIHSESAYNPKARSHIPAFGLMQIVPSSAGKDVYEFLYNEEKLVSDNYLYNSTNNITMGTAYLHMLYFKYLSKIKDKESRLYCAIAAYNTGAGNVAKAFSKTTNISKAAQIINKMSSKDVYNHLLKNLPYDETKGYLEKVTSRMYSYEDIYNK